jgi:hypothetical protein
MMLSSLCYEIERVSARTLRAGPLGDVPGDGGAAMRIVDIVASRLEL